MPIDAEMLHEIPIFALLDKDELGELAAHIDEASYAPNQTIFRAGDPGVNMQIILHGSVETYLLDEDGRRIILSQLGPGEMFGELSMLDREPRSANTIALEATRTFIIDRDDLQRLFSKKPAAALDILAMLGQRIRQTDSVLRSRVVRNPNDVVEEKLSFGDKLADGVARFGGSWNFIILFGCIMVTWIILNMVLLSHPFDPAPFIGLNLILSMLAALQAPIIMMSQNRQDAKDRVRSELDFEVNRKAEIEIMELHRKMDEVQSDVAQLEKHLNTNKAS